MLNLPGNVSPKKRKLEVCLDQSLTDVPTDNTDSLRDYANNNQVIEHLNNKVAELSEEVQTLRKHKQIETEIFQTQIAILRGNSIQQPKQDLPTEIGNENCSILDCIVELSKLNHTIILYLNQFQYKNKPYQSSFGSRV